MTRSYETLMCNQNLFEHFERSDTTTLAKQARHQAGSSSSAWTTTVEVQRIWDDWARGDSGIPSQPWQQKQSSIAALPATQIFAVWIMCLKGWNWKDESIQAQLTFCPGLPCAWVENKILIMKGTSCSTLAYFPLWPVSLVQGQFPCEGMQLGLMGIKSCWRESIRKHVDPRWMMLHLYLIRMISIVSRLLVIAKYQQHSTTQALMRKVRSLAWYIV